MQVKKDTSYGVVPLYKKDGIWQVLLVHQISYRGKNDTFWTLPKGHAEAGETPIEAARRELVEETGMQAVEIDEQTFFSTAYSFVHDGVVIEKTVLFWIGYCQNMSTQLTQPREVKELMWCDLASAGEVVSHKNTRKILEAVQASLR